ncbi:MAG TPA: protein kinase, partial [bacterium]|nr:protein kinase [bacterium]
LIGERLGAGSERAVARFVREAKISGQLEHPNIVPVYRLETRPDGGVYYVMRHVEGRTLLHAINEHSGKGAEKALAGRLSLLGDFIAVCEAVGYAHSKGIIHRDLKPSNVVLGEFGETIVLDWGLAKRLTDPETHDSASDVQPVAAEETGDGFKTIVGAKLGTPPYMAPEQIDRTLGQVDSKSDVYALGVILYLILTGEKPYSGTAKEMMGMIAGAEPSPSPRGAGTFVPPELAAICEKAMSKNRAERFASASEMATELKAYRDGRLVGVYAYSTTELIRRFVARNKALVGAMAAVVFSIAGGFAFATHYAVMAENARRQAEGALVEVTRISEEAVELARNTVAHFDDFFRILASDIGATAAAPAAPSDDLARLKNLIERHPEISALVLTRGGKALSYPADAIGRFGLPPPEIAKVRIEAAAGGFDATDAWKASDGRYAFAFVFGAGADGDTLTAIFTIDKLMPAAFAFDPRKNPYQIWCMDADGTILYDENPEEIGKNLFTDEMYANYPELRALGEEMRQKSWGVGYYRFFASSGDTVIYKIAAWESLSPAGGVNWKLVAAFPFESK